MKITSTLIAKAKKFSSRKKLYKTINFLYNIDLDTFLEDLHSNINKLTLEQRNNAKVIKDYDYDNIIYIQYIEEELEEEWEQRALKNYIKSLETEKINKKKKKENERKEYERLKKKFG